MKHKLFLVTLFCSINFIQTKLETPLSLEQRKELIKERNEKHNCVRILYSLYMNKQGTVKQRHAIKDALSKLENYSKIFKCERYEKELNTLFEQALKTHHLEKKLNTFSIQDLNELEIAEQNGHSYGIRLKYDDLRLRKKLNLSYEEFKKLDQENIKKFDELMDQLD